MKKRKNLIWLFFVLSLCIFPACKKDDTRTPQSKLALLKKTWKVSQVTQKGISTPVYQNPLPNGQTNTEDYSQYELSLTDESHYRITERNGSSKSGTWELSADETKIIFDKAVAGKEWSATLLELSEKSLKLLVSSNSIKTGTRELQIDFVPV